MPVTAVACGSSGAKDSCSKEMTSKSDKKECCCSKPCSKEKKNKGCDGKCGHSSCTTSSVNMSFLLNTTFETPINVFNFSFEKQKFYSLNSITSDGYSSIWLIPKIS